MSNSESIEIEQSGEVALTSIMPILQRLESHVQHIGQRVDSFVPRRTISESVKERHRNACTYLGGRCPCCRLVDVLDGNSVNGEFDHFYSRERNGFEDTWLICFDCHRQMKIRAVYTDEFRSYQRRAVALENGQLTLL